jgi:DNA invertase Pin-like site-specific DNA recombinase
MKLDGYIRVSRVGGREGDSFISPGVQREKIEQWAALRGAEIIEWHTDLDQTGGKFSRPGLDALMDRIRSGATEGVAVAKLDRLSRAGVADALKLVQEIHDHGATLAAVDLGIDPTTSFGEFGLTLMLALGRMERRRITENWQTARQHANARGIHQSKAPFGYSRGKGERLVPDENAKWVRRIFEDRAMRITWADIARMLNAEGVATPGKGRQWIRGTVKDLASNEVYLGTAYHGEFRHESAHEALVSPALFAAATGKSINPSQVKGEGNLLAGLLRCAGCSYCLAGGRSGSAHDRVRHYACKKRHASGTCKEAAGIRSQYIEPWVVERFFAHIEKPTMAPRKATDDYSRAREAVEQADAELRRYLADAELRSLLEDDEWRVGVRARKAAVTLAKRSLLDARSEATGVKLPPLVDLRTWWEKQDVAERRATLANAIDAVMVKAVGRGHRVSVDDRAQILWRGQGPSDLPRQGQAGVMRPYPFAPDYLPLDPGVLLPEPA